MAFAPTKSKKHRKSEKQELSLNSMMDMMTIILLFLIKSMSTSGALIKPSQYLELPKAIREAEPKKALAFLLTENGVLDDMEGEQRIISGTDELSDPSLMVLPGLEQFLMQQKDFKEKAGIEFKGEVTIQCDKNAPYEWLLKVINTCGQTEYQTIDFVVIKTS